MPTPSIAVSGLCKTYDVPVRGGGLRSAIKSLVRKKTRLVDAVKDISFVVQSGEMVGFLGPNGAGKTTTLKMLSGLLHPTRGEACVLGHEPYAREKEFLSQITLVMGNRNQLVWDIPVIDSFERNRAIYRISHQDYKQTLESLTGLLELDSLLEKPVRNLSLGERMKCEVAVSLLHRPKVLFLDEPTIGLDVTMQRRLRSFVAEYNSRYEATVLLTSHYMADVEALCRRVVLVHNGELLFDGPLTNLRDRFSSYKKITVEHECGDVDLKGYGTITGTDEGRITLRVLKSDTAQVTSRLLSELRIKDLTVEESSIDEVIEQAFANDESQ